MRKLFQELMKNLKIDYIENESIIKYEEYYFNGIPIPQNIEFKEIGINSLKILWNINNINFMNIDKNELKYKIELKKENSNENLKEIIVDKSTNYTINNLESNTEITEDIINEYKKINNNQDFIFIKGLRLKGFEGHKEEDREIKTYKENLDNPDGELLPVIAITYTINEYKTVIKKNKEEESDEEDEEEEIFMNQEEKADKFEEKPQASGGGGPKDGEDEEDKKDKTEEKKIEIKAENKKSIEVETVKIKKEVKITQKIKIKYYKKHCKLEIPFIEQRDENVYNINEPYGYIEIRFDCDKFRQEEYFVNKNIVIVLDK